MSVSNRREVPPDKNEQVYLVGTHTGSARSKDEFFCRAGVRVVKAKGQGLLPYPFSLCETLTLLFQRVLIKIVCDCIKNPGILAQSLKGAMKEVGDVDIHLD
ncbi:MAG: hypothetical protein CSA35_09680 [Dethiosulfovibrio peptidovorans]|nr:MAG: hypothetical protein CSA35_09680 [Dethiosulfovibrio peptidovorans]